MSSGIPVSAVQKRIENLERYVNQLRIIPATNVYRTKVVLPILSKALNVSRAICTLVKAGFPAEAFAMSRTLIDIFFCVRYMSNRDTDSRITTYVEHAGKVHEEWGNIIKKFFPNNRVVYPSFHKDMLRLAKKFRSKHLWTGLGGQAKAMALEEDMRETDEQGKPFKNEFDYEVLYFWTSQFVHVTVRALDAHASPPGEVFRIRSTRRAEAPRGQDALFNVLVYLSKTMVCVCRIIREEQPEIILQDMQRLMRKHARYNKKIAALP